MKINSPYVHYIKPAMDLTGALMLFIAIFPAFAIICLILMVSGQPVFFRQLRPGYKEKIFGVLKFTTMIRGDATIPFSFGRFLRKTSLDELPQLLNVMKGDMSLIGPRPLLIDYLEHYTAEEHLRHHLKPGMTGLAQVSGRNALPLAEKISLDIQYVRQVSFRLDLIILFRTVRQLLRWDQADFHSEKTAKLEPEVG